MLTNKEKKYLKKASHELKPLFQIGKNGVNEELVNQLDDLLTKRELIKVHILQNSDEEVEEAAYEISSALSAEVVQTIGRVMTLYRQSSESKYRQISEELKAVK